ncbi:unnamed protein product, partial [Adineta steineri]
LSNPYSLFVAINGDIYVDNGYANGRVDKWTLNSSASISAMYVKNSCWGLFLDINNNLYCSMNSLNQVVMKSLNTNSAMWIVAAGADCSAPSTNTLNGPRGIYVDTDLNLYVADCGNNRIQLFLSTQLIGKNGPNGFRCLVGCSGVSGASSNQLYYPTALSFDSYGNMYAVDQNNYRIQKFLITSTYYEFNRSSELEIWIWSCVTLNQPNLCPSTTWYTNGITFANSSTIGTVVSGSFVSINNTVYVANQQTNKVIV